MVDVSPHPALRIATIATEERARRVAVLCRDIAAGRITRTRAIADELLWFHIEMWARRLGGDPEGARYGLPDDFAALIATAEATRTAAAQGKAADQKQADLRDLHHWLVLHRIYTLPRAAEAPIPEHDIAA